MNSAAEAVETMIARDNESSLIVNCLEHLANHGVAMEVTFVDDTRELAVRWCTPMGWVIGLPEAPEHVRDAVRCVEQDVEQTALELIQGQGHHCLTLAPDDGALVEESFFRDPLVVQSGGVLGHARCVVGADSPGQVSRELRRCADRIEGKIGIEVDRGCIQLQFRFEVEQAEPHQPTDRLEQPVLELDTQPIAPGPQRNLQLLR